MKLGLVIGYWNNAGPPVGVREQIAEAEKLGFDSMWTAEAYGSDAFTPLAWWGSETSRIKLGTSVVQISARTPAATAMSAITMDHLSNGRLMLGLGASGPQVVEGWYGQPYPKPLARTREYVEILRRIFKREEIDFQGAQYQMPNRGDASTGLGKPLKSIVKPLRDDIPILLGAEGPKNVAMAAEIGDGWLPIFFSPKSDKFYRDALGEGFARPTARHSLDDFEVPATVPVIIGDDVEECASFMKPMMALYIGGMGAREVNFHFDVFARMGHEEACHKIQDAYLGGRKADAIAQVPTRLIEDVALVGPKEKVLDELEQWKGTVLTTMLVSGPPELLGQIAELVG